MEEFYPTVQLGDSFLENMLSQGGLKVTAVCVCVCVCVFVRVFVRVRLFVHARSVMILLL